MGLNPFTQTQQQPGGIDKLAQNAMFPQSQQEHTQFATPSQMPTSAEVVDADYDAPTDSYTGMPTKPFAYGGIASIPRYDGEDGSVVQAAAPAVNPDLVNLDPELLGGDEGIAKLNALKATDPKAYNSQLMSALSKQMQSQYNTNSNYVPTWQQFQSLQSSDPAQWHREQLAWLGHHQGWQIGQNTSDRNAAEQPVIQDEIEQARKAGLSDQEIQQILSGSSQSANYQNQQRIAQEAASGGNGIGDLVKVAAPIALSMALGPEMMALAPELGAVGAGALTGATVGGIGAGITGGDIGKGVLMGGATGALGGSLNGIDPSITQGLNAAKSAYSLSQNPNNPMAAIGAAKNVASMIPVNAAHGGLMAGGGIANLGSYSDGGQLLKGPGDGMSDNIPAKIGQHQPARLADGEFVIPADVVSHLGNGSTDAGAKQLYKMMDRIRAARTGNPKQGKRINPDKFLPKG